MRPPPGRQGMRHMRAYPCHNSCYTQRATGHHIITQLPPLRVTTATTPRDAGGCVCFDFGSWRVPPPPLFSWFSVLVCVVGRCIGVVAGRGGCGCERMGCSACRDRQGLRLLRAQALLAGMHIKCHTRNHAHDLRPCVPQRPVLYTYILAHVNDGCHTYIVPTFTHTHT